MKKRIQKYLSGSNEGFSLVELIIVIAIMAILVGVVALAVIPNLERSRESKDLTTLDGACSALAAAVANAGTGASAGSGTPFAISNVVSGAADPVHAAMFEQLGDCSTMKMTSSASGGVGADSIMCLYDVDTNVVSVYIGTDVDNATQCKYQKEADGTTLKRFAVSNGK